MKKYVFNGMFLLLIFFVSYSTSLIKSKIALEHYNNTEYNNTEYNSSNSANNTLNNSLIEKKNNQTNVSSHVSVENREKIR